MKRKAVGLLLAVLICVGMFAGCGGEKEGAPDELPYVGELDGYEVIIENYVVVNTHVGDGFVSYMYGFYDFPDDKTSSEMKWILKDDAGFYMKCGEENELHYMRFKPGLLLENKVVIKGQSGYDDNENRYPFKEGDNIVVAFTGNYFDAKLTADKMIEVNRGNNIVSIGEGISQEQLDYIKADLYL